jgi:hypothetical protein
MNIKPILFNTSMVKAILKGRKTQTRRVVKNNNSLYGSKFSELDFNDAFVDGLNDKYLKVKHPIDNTRQRVFSKIETGDILWVREGFRYVHHYGFQDKFVQYRNMGTNAHCNIPDADQIIPDESGWKPSIHMPKEACRIFLEVTNVRVERLNDISEQDAIDEGIKVIEPEEAYYDYDGGACGAYATAKGSFFSLWNSINGKDSWEDNPWVWVYDFNRTERPAGFLE